MKKCLVESICDGGKRFSVIQGVFLDEDGEQVGLLRLEADYNKDKDTFPTVRYSCLHGQATDEYVEKLDELTALTILFSAIIAEKRSKKTKINYRQCNQSARFMFYWTGRGKRGLKAVRTATSHFINWWPCPGWRRGRV